MAPVDQTADIAYPCPVCGPSYGGIGKRHRQMEHIKDWLYLYCDRCPHSWKQKKVSTEDYELKLAWIKRIRFPV